jgi:hypothetical protein
MRVAFSLGRVGATEEAERVCRSRSQAIVLRLTPTARSLRIETDDARVARYVRAAYGAALVDSASASTDSAVLTAGSAFPTASFNGVDLPHGSPGSVPCAWRSYAYLVDQCVWRALARERAWIALYACAVQIDGRAVILVGPSGVGKTTLGFALQRHGARMIGDEMALVRVRDATVDAIDRRFSVRRPRRTLAVDRRRYGALPLPARLAATFVVSRGEGEPQVAPAAASVMACAIAAYAAQPPSDLEGVARLARILSVGRCFTLRLGDVHASAAAVIESVRAC